MLVPFLWSPDQKIFSWRKNIRKTLRGTQSQKYISKLSSKKWAKVPEKKSPWHYVKYILKFCAQKLKIFRFPRKLNYRRLIPSNLSMSIKWPKRLIFVLAGKLEIEFQLTWLCVDGKLCLNFWMFVGWSEDVLDVFCTLISPRGLRLGWDGIFSCSESPPKTLGGLGKPIGLRDVLFSSLILLL